ncbi:MAG: Do family serine endopeptidase [Bdellovibrionales bacterium]|nr:Do family serine endopeptidase [Bdellovibrionales bacterium]
MKLSKPILIVLCLIPHLSQAESLWKEGKDHPKQRVNTQASSLSPQIYLQVSEAVREAVVNISTTRETSSHPYFQGRSGAQDPFGDLFERFFGGQNPLHPQQGPGSQASSLGSGFVISESGYIVTNNHVVEKAKDITVIFSDESELKAQVVGRDPKTDVALLKVDPKGKKLRSVILGDSDAMKVGEIAIAIGNPFGLSYSVTQGIISAKERSIGIVGQYDDFIQTDASINPGNSGGPLLNLYGEVIGINTAILASGQGIGFAIPINLAKQILLQLKESGRVVRGQLGVMVQKVTHDLVKALELQSKKGALVAQVVEGSPADKAGLKAGDVIVKYDGKEVKDWHKLPIMVAASKVGKEVEIEVIRDGKTKKIQSQITELEDEQSPVETQPKEVESPLGMKVEPLSSPIKKALGLDPKLKGVVVSKIDQSLDKQAFNAGLQRGDVITQIKFGNTKVDIESMQDYHQALQAIEKLPDGKRFLMLVVRGKQNLFVTMKKDDSKEKKKR